MFLIQLGIAFSYEEKSSVARIVGDSPIDMLQQLKKDAIYLRHATYFSDNIWNNRKYDILNKQFENNLNANIKYRFDAPEDYYIQPYNFDEVKESFNDFRNNELFILEADGNADILHTEAYGSKLYPQDLVQWQNKFKENEPLFLFNSPYAGVYLPKENTFVSRLVKDSTIIAPTLFNSKQFTKSFICNLIDDKTVGYIFKKTRNFHYNGKSEPSTGNPIGLVLQSYSLYGNPRQKIIMDWSEEDKKKIRQYCDNFLENLAPNIEFLEQTGNYSKFRKHVVFEIPSFIIEDLNGFSTINAENTFQNLEINNLVLPMAVRTTHFPLRTIITDYRIDYTGDYEDITIENLPSYQFEFVNRTCYSDNQSYKVDFENSFTEDTQDFTARVYPVEVIDCNQGKVRLYKRFNYSIDYIALSPVLIENVNLPLNVPVNELTNAEIELLPLTDKAVQGKLAIFNNERNKIWEKDISTDVLNYTAQFKAPSGEGLQKYNVEFIYNNETVNYKEFSFFTSILDVKTDIPISVNENPSLNFNFYSYNNENFDLGASYYLFHNQDLINSGSFSKMISKGDNLYALTLNNLEREDQSYILILELSYLGEKKSISYLLNTNNIPILYLESEKEYTTEENVTIIFNAIDYDNDALTYSIDDERFAKHGNSFTWNPDKNDEGSYEVKITVSDGFSENEKIIHFVVNPAEDEIEENINNVPVVEDINNITVNETDIATITVNAMDLDNDTLIYSINDSRFTQNNNLFTWQTSSGDSGIYNVRITVSDSKDNVFQDIKITVNKEVQLTYGDVNFDGKVNILDVVRIVNHITGKSNFTDAKQLKVADVDFEEGITSNDVVLVVDYILEKIKELPYKPQSSVINNQFSPNLIINYINVQYSNNDLVADVSVKNIGTGVFYEDINNAVALIGNNNMNISLAKKERLKLSPMESRVQSYTYKNIPSGTYALNTKIDSESEAIESSKDDNSKEATIKI